MGRTKKQQRIFDRLNMLQKLIPKSEVRISNAEVPHLVVDSKYSVCYFGSTKIYRVWGGYATPANKKLADFATVKEVVDFFRGEIDGNKI